MARFPVHGVAEEVLRQYFRPDGTPPGAPYRLVPMYRHVVSHARERFSMLAAFVEVDLAREGHDGVVGLNLLTKAMVSNLALLYGAMLAGVDYVLMGAGIPREIPAALDALAQHKVATLKLDVEGLVGDRVELITLDPSAHGSPDRPALKRPRFLPIVSSHVLAMSMAKRPGVDGFIIEAPVAGGHNAPPRVDVPWNDRGEPVYGPRDEVDLSKLRDLGKPFWLAGGVGRPEGLKEALAQGATGIQVGTLFAYCDESGIAPEIKRSVLAAVRRGEIDVRTDPEASPTGYPFKVVEWKEAPVASHPRERRCDLGYLRLAYVAEDGTIGYRCASEPVDDFVRKGGRASDTVGRLCLCNGLLATVGLGQHQKDGSVELPMVTSGDDLKRLGTFLAGREHYAAADVLAWLLASTPAAVSR
jgi:NAD(P)H-dependent flavin oxidoreductase YrpB (nitropropane dioxygenase family)